MPSIVYALAGLSIMSHGLGHSIVHHQTVFTIL